MAKTPAKPGIFCLMPVLFSGPSSVYSKAAGADPFPFDDYDDRFGCFIILPKVTGNVNRENLTLFFPSPRKMPPKRNISVKRCIF